MYQILSNRSFGAAHAFIPKAANSLPGPGRLGPTPGANEAAVRLKVMEAAFLPTGGIVSGDGLSDLMRCHFDQPISTLARWIVRGEALSFQLSGQTWVPMFQFDPTNYHLRPGVAAVICELQGVFDEWELACWFAQPNSSVNGQTPAAAMACNPLAVLDAARIDRFVAAG